MRWSASLTLALGLLLPGTTSFGQEEGPCLSPQAASWGSPRPAVRGGMKGGEGPSPALYVSSSGRLCAEPGGLVREVHPLQTAAQAVPGPGRAFLLSAVIPGMGQRALGLDRWAGYVAAEGWAWAQFFSRRSEGHRVQKKYRELAWLVARRVSSGRRMDGGFEYYEALTQYNSSGAYDTDPDQAGIQPEENPETYNGTIWALSRQIFSLDDPEAPVAEDSELYVKALKYYISRAYTPTYAWNWSSNTLQQAEFASLIRSSDENLRRSTNMVGVMLANHLLSAVDALVSARLGQEARDEPTVTLSLLPGPFQQDAFVLAVRLPFQ